MLNPKDGEGAFETVRRWAEQQGNAGPATGAAGSADRIEFELRDEGRMVIKVCRLFLRT